MSARFDVAGMGNALVDIIAPATESFLDTQGLRKGSMVLLDDAWAASLYDAMAPGVETSGGSAANTLAGVASLGGRGAFIGKVASDQLGEVFAHDMRAIGVQFETPFLDCGPATGRCLINVTPDGQRTMATFLGASTHLTDSDVDEEVVRASEIVFLEGYLFEPDAARRAFLKAAGVAHDAGRKVAMTLSDTFIVEKWRPDLLAFLEEVDILFANEAEITALFQTDFDSAVAALRSRVDTAGVTRSEKGSVVLSDGSSVAVAAEPVEQVLDTTGAGDQYAAGFLFGLASERSPAECGRLGSIAAAEVIAHYGPRPQVPLAELVRSAGL